MKKFFTALSLALSLVCAISAAPAWADKKSEAPAKAAAEQTGVGTYDIDKDHSSVGFRIRHLVSKVPGRFSDYSGQITLDPTRLETLQANATIKASSIDTGNKKRDDHLRGPDFLDAKKYPTLDFKSTKASFSDKTTGKLEGTLTLHGVTKPVIMDVTFGGEAVDPWGNKRIGLSGKTTINRKDFGIVWNKTMDAGSVMLGDEMEITLEIEAIRKK